MTRKTEPAASATHLAWLPLLCGLGLMLVITVYPGWLADAQGKADHSAATLACLAMAAGFVRGVGFVPQNKIARTLLGGWACAIYGGLLLLRLYG